MGFEQDFLLLGVKGSPCGAHCFLERSRVITAHRVNAELGLGMGFWLRWGGVLLGAISLFSLVQKLSDFGLAPIFKDMLGFYRATFHPIADIIINALKWALALVSIRLPKIPPDVVVIYLLIGTALLRHAMSVTYKKRDYLVQGATYSGDISEQEKRRQTKYWEGAARTSLMLSALFSLLWPVGILVGMVVRRDMKRSSPQS